MAAGQAAELAKLGMPMHLQILNLLAEEVDANYDVLPLRIEDLANSVQSLRELRLSFDEVMGSLSHLTALPQLTSLSLQGPDGEDSEPNDAMQLSNLAGFSDLARLRVTCFGASHMSMQGMTSLTRPVITTSQHLSAVSGLSDLQQLKNLEVRRTKSLVMAHLLHHAWRTQLQQLNLFR